MHASVFKRTLVFLLALVLLATSLPFLGTNVQAAASSTVASKVCANLPILTYAMPLSGVCRNYPGNQQHCSQCPVSGTLGKEKRLSGIRDLILHRNTAACSGFFVYFKRTVKSIQKLEVGFRRSVEKGFRLVSDTLAVSL